MRIQELRANLTRAGEIAKNLLMIEGELGRAKLEDEKELLRKSHSSLIEQLRIINNSLPSLLSDRETVAIDVVSINRSDQKKYLDEMRMEKELLKRLGKKIALGKAGRKEDYRKAGILTKNSSRLFSKASLNLSNGKLFDSVGRDLKKANMPYLLPTYISMMLFITLITFASSLVIFLVLSLLGVMGVLYAVIAIILLPIVAFAIAFYYPSTEARSNSNRIEEELPFAVINMSAIAGSGVEPTRVFRILAESPEYPAMGKEMKKLVNLINFYGYDLTTALSSTAKTTSNRKLAELLNGMSMIISTGGNMQEYLNKISSDTLLDYRLRRKRYVTVAETYADIYTGLLIAAPLMFMLLLTMINVIGGNLGGLDPLSLSLIGLGAIALINIAFLVFLEVSAPGA